MCSLDEEKVLYELDKKDERIAALEAQLKAEIALRPQWAMGFSSDSIAAQTAMSALHKLWKLLEVTHQTDAVHKLRSVLTRVSELELELARKDTQLGQLLDHCDDGECHTCGSIICPHGDPMHFHHDGCPTCAQMEEAMDGLQAMDEMAQRFSESYNRHRPHFMTVVPALDFHDRQPSIRYGLNDGSDRQPWPFPRGGRK